MIQLKPYQPTDFELYLPLYLSAFPEEERRATEDWKDYLNKGQTKALTISEDGQFKGFITYWIFEKFTYAEHFVIRAEERGNGIGTRAFESFLKQLPDLPLVLEVEPEHVNELAKKRIEFYNRQKLVVLNTKYVQPAYQDHLPGIDLRLMTTHPKVVAPIINEIIRTLYKDVYNKEIDSCITFRKE